METLSILVFCLIQNQGQRQHNRLFYIEAVSTVSEFLLSSNLKSLK